MTEGSLAVLPGSEPSSLDLAVPDPVVICEDYRYY